MLCDLKTITVLDRLRIIDRPYHSTNRQLHRKDFITVNNVLTGKKKIIIIFWKMSAESFAHFLSHTVENPLSSSKFTELSQLF